MKVETGDIRRRSTGREHPKFPTLHNLGDSLQPRTLVVFNGLMAAGSFGRNSLLVKPHGCQDPWLCKL